jgi:hypothetical protein
VEDENADVKAEASTTLEESDEDFELWVTRMKRAARSARISVAIEQNNAGASHTETRVAQVVTDVTVSGEGYPFTFTLMRETIIYKNQIFAASVLRRNQRDLPRESMGKLGIHLRADGRGGRPPLLSRL